MTLDDIYKLALKHFPLAHITEDMDGEIVIATGMKMEDEVRRPRRSLPLGMQGLTAANIPGKYHADIQLREMTSEDIA